MTHNTRGGIEETVSKMLAIGWDSKMKKHDGTSIVVSFTKAELCDLLLNLEENRHQELQKAREEERERCITEAWSYIVDATHAESWGREELRKRLTPPDQTANPTN